MKSIKNNFHWNNFYKTFKVKKESSFARFFYKKIKKKKLEARILDVGCGNGRDTFFFLKKGFNTIGIDISKTAIKQNKKIYNKNFFLKDLCLKKINFKKKFNIIYARFFLHAISSKQESFFFENLKKICKKKILVFLEFRTIKDPLFEKGLKISKYERYYGHYRRFIDINKLKKKIITNGYSILNITSNYNYAKFGNERPHVCRLIIEFKKL